MAKSEKEREREVAKSFISVTSVTVSLSGIRNPLMEPIGIGIGVMIPIPIPIPILILILILILFNYSCPN